MELEKQFQATFLTNELWVSLGGTVLFSLASSPASRPWRAKPSEEPVLAIRRYERRRNEIINHV